jgi:hypothetical protein
MNEKGNRYAISALTNKRATLASEIVQLERQIRSRKASLQHVDAWPVYWLAISCAAHLALLQLVTAPYYWEKTEHTAGMKA